MRPTILLTFAIAGIVHFASPILADTIKKPSASIPSRYMMGKPGQLSVPQLTKQVQEAMRTSMQIRRRMAWDLIENLLAEKQLDRFAEWRLPLWATQYASDDIQRLARLNRDQSHLPFSELEDLHERALEFNSVWQEQNFFTWLGYFRNIFQVRGSIGLIRTLYNSPTLERIFTDKNHLGNCELNSENMVLPRAQSNDFAPCLTEEFSSSTVVVKVAWQRLHPRITFPIFKTDTASLLRRLMHKDASWQVADTWGNPATEDLYTIELRDGSRFGLVGMHIMTKQLREWWWISMWWSPDPESDFAKDKPNDKDFWNNRPWSNYQLCTVTDYLEQAADSPKVGKYPYSWCSNPYLEKGQNNAASNCIGCHQHAGTNLSQEIILEDIQSANPLLLAPLRTDFPTDYIWSVGAEIKHMLK